MSNISPRARDLGLKFPGSPGQFNAITDVPGVSVGFAQVLADHPKQVRTGVTAIIPHADSADLKPTWAGFFALNGNGEMTGTHWINEAGYFKGPICITNTHSVGMVHHSVVGWMTRRYASLFEDQHVWAMPVVAETYDGALSDINGRHITEAHVLSALDSARSGPVAEGNVGGGTGMISYEFKGGTGSSSRMVQLGQAGQEIRGVVATLVQANHGLRDWLSVLGVPVGQHLRDDLLFPRETGSIIVVLATDLPLSSSQLKRLAKRAALGIGRGGTPGGNNSGDIFIAFSTANSLTPSHAEKALWSTQTLNDDLLDSVYLAAVQAVEEATINALVAAKDTPTFKPADHWVRALPHDKLIDLMRQYGR